MKGVTVHELEHLVDHVVYGRRVFVPAQSPTFEDIAIVREVPLLQQAQPRLVRTPHRAKVCTGACCVLAPTAELPLGAREVKAIVWDNVVVYAFGRAAGVGKVVRFSAGEDGFPDVWTVRSLRHDEFDPRLLGMPTLGWDAATWPENYARAVANAPLNGGDLVTRSVLIDLHAQDFQRYPNYVTMRDAMKLVIVPRTTLARATSYAELIGAEERGTTATHFVCIDDAKNDLCTVVETLRAFATAKEANQAGEGAAEVHFWFDALALDHRDVAHAGCITSSTLERVSCAIEAIQNVLVVVSPWMCPAVSQRMQSLFEIGEAKRFGGRTTFLVPAAERRALEAHGDRGLIEAFDEVAERLARVSFERSAVGVDFGEHTALAPLLARASMSPVASSPLAGDGTVARKSLLVVEVDKGLAVTPRKRRGSWFARGSATPSPMVSPRSAPALPGLWGLDLRARVSLLEWLASLGKAALARRPVGATDEATLQLTCALGRLLLKRRSRTGSTELEEAESLLRAADVNMTKTMTPRRATVCRWGARSDLADAMAKQGRMEEAEAAHRTELAAQVASLGRKHAVTQRTVSRLAKYLTQAAPASSEAEALWREALAECTSRLGSRHYRTLEVLLELARVTRAQQRFCDAEPLFRRYAEVSFFFTVVLDSLSLTHCFVRRYAESLAATRGGVHEDAVAAAFMLLDVHRTIALEQRQTGAGSAASTVAEQRAQDSGAESSPDAAHPLRSLSSSLSSKLRISGSPPELHRLVSP